MVAQTRFELALTRLERPVFSPLNYCAISVYIIRTNQSFVKANIHNNHQ